MPPVNQAQKQNPTIEHQTNLVQTTRLNITNLDEDGLGAISRSQMKDVSPKNTNMQVSGNFKSWAKDMIDYLFWHDRSIKELIEYFDSTWILHEKLSYEDIWKCCASSKLHIDVAAALDMVIGASPEV